MGFKPEGALRREDVDVDETASDKEAKAFVIANHYSGSYPAAMRRFRAIINGKIVGYCIYSQPMSVGIFKCFDCEPSKCMDLGRLVIADGAGKNAATIFISKTMKILARDGILGVIATSDPKRRMNRHGDVVFGGHIGAIYQALNARYIGRTKPRTLRIFEDGSLLSERTMQKARGKERGFAYAEKVLLDKGARPREANEDVAAWANRSIAEITTPMKHAGNHKYAWVIGKGSWREGTPSLPYPKDIDPA